MADWKHYEAIWDSRDETDEEWLSFTEWLDEMCEGGGEVIKIQRYARKKSRSGMKGEIGWDEVWCVFRKKE